MSCSVAVSNSPMFSPSSSMFCNNPSILSPETLSHFKSSSSPSSPHPSSPSSPFRLRVQKPSTGFSSNAVSGSNSCQSSCAVLKRKRPTKLDIPVAPMGFGAVAATPREGRRETEREGDDYSVFCKKGRREAMEDRYSALVNVEGDSKQAFFGVFDGHGGTKAAEFAAENLNRNIIKEFANKNGDEIKESIKIGYLTTDDQFLKQDMRGGSCCVTALIRKGNLFVSNAGDCRAVMSKGGVAQPLTHDHRPSREDERERIVTTGGYVDFFHGVWRLQGSLAVSRGIGDRHLKQWVIAEPETQIVEIKPEHEFLILASDGLWDKVSNQEAVDIARGLCIGVDKPSSFSACKKLVELSASRGSSDDTSVMIIQLPNYVSSSF